MSFLILESTYDWDGHTFHFIPHIGNHVWQRRTDFLCHSSYWNPRMTDGHTFHFIPHIGNHVCQTDRQHFISFLIFETTYDRRTDNIAFHSSYWKPRMTETDRHFISFLILETTYDWDGQTFHFIPHIGNHVWLRRTDNISFHSSYWKPRITETDRQHFISFLILETTFDWDGQTFHFNPHIGNHVWLRRTDISFHSSYLKPRMTDGQTFHFIPPCPNLLRGDKVLIFVPSDC